MSSTVIMIHIGLSFVMAIAFLGAWAQTFATRRRLSKLAKQHDPDLWDALFLRVFHTSIFSFISRLKAVLPELDGELKEVSTLFIKQAKRSLWLFAGFIVLISLTSLCG